MTRYSAIGRHGKRFALTWVDPATISSDATCAIAFDDDYTMGILQSSAHIAWAWHQSSTLETRLRYTQTSVFETFPWPGPVTDAQREAVAAASRAMLDCRAEICAAEQIGLTTLYNAVDEGAYTDLKALHRTLDAAVAACYGWPKTAAKDSARLVTLLLALNQEITAGGRSYVPF